MAKIPSNVSLFAKRGDPWITERQREKDFVHNTSENPDMDRWTKAGFARPRHERKDNKPGVSRDTNASGFKLAMALKAATDQEKKDAAKKRYQALDKRVAQRKALQERKDNGL